ncbi:MAG: NADH-quinone oxidoreductase subunit C [Deltaproteobacteria bacterium]|jgi:NADH-quinone oxidoreductase subunit C|nr:NADH-quinone oxidoreductase subunit C [Deltaproteobacteria bacterium]
MTAAIDPGILRQHLAGLEIELGTAADGALRLVVGAEQSLVLLRRLRDEPEIDLRRLVDLTAIDRGVARGRFEVVYLLASSAPNARVRIHVPLDEGEPIIDSVVALWPAADWLEREVFDLFGITFRAHPNLRRILLEPDFEGAPLRKDHPLQLDRPLPEKVVL